MARRKGEMKVGKGVEEGVEMGGEGGGEGEPPAVEEVDEPVLKNLFE